MVKIVQFLILVLIKQKQILLGISKVGPSNKNWNDLKRKEMMNNWTEVDFEN